MAATPGRILSLCAKRGMPRVKLSSHGKHIFVWCGGFVGDTAEWFGCEHRTRSSEDENDFGEHGHNPGGGFDVSELRLTH